MCSGVWDGLPVALSPFPTIFMITKERYLEVLEQNLALNSDFWFDDSGEDVPDDFEYSGKAAIALVEQGETFWECPGWVADIAREFEHILFDGNLIRLRLTAEWLLKTMPNDSPDEELAAKLRYLADGEFCVVFEGRSSHRLNSSEYYRKTLNWKMDRYVSEDLVRQFRTGNRH